VTREEEPGRGDPIGLLDWRKIIPFEPAASSDRLGWVGLQAARLANLVAVHLIRNASARLPPTRRSGGALSPGRLRAVVEYVEEHLDAGPSLEQLAAAAHLSVYHFARQFKAATGLPPHQYVIARRVKRARQLLQGGDLSLAEVATHAGFSDQSQFSRHFKRFVGVTPGQFRTPARKRKEDAARFGTGWSLPGYR
jgi:AraC-like DNA-binding protein